MPFGKREKDTGEPIPAKRFGIMGDPDAHEDPKKVNPVTTATPVSPAAPAGETPAPTDEKDGDQ